MGIRASLPAALLLASAAAVFAADPPKGPWEGFGLGSWVRTKTATRMIAPGLDTPEHVSESRQTLVNVLDTEWIVKTETKSDDAWTGGTLRSLPRVAPRPGGQSSVVPAGKREDLPGEKVAVEGQEYPCRKLKSVSGTRVAILWISEEHGLLKSETKDGDTSISLVVTAFAKKAKVGETEVSCRETKTVMKSPDSEMTAVDLSSSAVPNRTVRMDMTTVSGVVKTTSLTEVLEFEAK